MEHQKEWNGRPGGDISPAELARLESDGGVSGGGTSATPPDSTPDTLPDYTLGGGSCGCGCGDGGDPCGEDSWGLKEHPLAMVYAPCQTFRAVYDPETALSRGTMFAELDLPLEVGGGGSCGCSWNQNTRTGGRSNGCGCGGRSNGRGYV